MTAEPLPHDPEAGTASVWWRDAGWLLTAATVIVVPLAAVPNALDPFRLPKDLVLRAAGFLMAVLWAWRAFDRSAGRPRLPRRYVIVLAAICGWTVIAALFASHKVHAAFALLWIGCGVLLFLTAFRAVRRRSVLAIAAVCAIAPVVNAIVAVAEAATGWFPFLVEEHGTRAIGLQGNANDVGALLAPAIILALAIAASVRRLRIPAFLVAVICMLGIVASQTLTSMLAVAAGAAAMVIVYSPRRGILSAVLVTIILGASALTYPPTHDRIASIGRRVKEGRIEEAMSNRLTPWLVAWRMAVASPVVGLGPGSFGWNYFPYKIETERRYSQLLGLDRVQPGYSRYASTINFGEAHNEYLEVLAEAGAPALLILVSALGVVAYATKRAGGEERAQVARYLSAPFAVTSAVSCAAGFPLQLAGSCVVLIFIAAVSAAWATTP